MGHRPFGEYFGAMVHAGMRSHCSEQVPPVELPTHTGSDMPSTTLPAGHEGGPIVRIPLVAPLGSLLQIAAYSRLRVLLQLRLDSGMALALISVHAIHLIGKRD